MSSHKTALDQCWPALNVNTVRCVVAYRWGMMEVVNILCIIRSISDPAVSFPILWCAHMLPTYYVGNILCWQHIMLPSLILWIDASNSNRAAVGLVRAISDRIVNGVTSPTTNMDSITCNDVVLAHCLVWIHGKRCQRIGRQIWTP